MDLNPAIKVAEDVNNLLSKLIPIIPNVMGIVGLVRQLITNPNADPALRREAIQTLRANGVTLSTESLDWLREHGYDEQGHKLPT